MCILIILQEKPIVQFTVLVVRVMVVELLALFLFFQVLDDSLPSTELLF